MRFELTDAALSLISYYHDEIGMDVRLSWSDS